MKHPDRNHYIGIWSERYGCHIWYGYPDPDYVRNLALSLSKGMAPEDERRPRLAMFTSRLAGIMEVQR